MAKKTKSASQSHAPLSHAHVVPTPREHLARGVMLALWSGLCVARPLLPSEGVSWLGDGHPFTLLAIFLAAGYCLLSLARGGFARPIGAVDAAVGALVVVMAATDLLAAGVANPRMSVNMLWEWVGLGLGYFLTRQLIQSEREARALVGLMLAVAVVMTAIGFWQILVSLPQDRAAFAADPERVMVESLGQSFPLGSPERQQFENRLHSTEPLATFALTNSLAGFLVPWLLVGLGILGQWFVSPRAAGSGNGPTELASAERSSGQTSVSGLAWGRGAMLCLLLLAMAACLILTKSRSGYVALALGVLMLPLCWQQASRRHAWRWALGGGIALALVAGLALASKGLDVQVVTEAGKSLSFRRQYWQSTLQIIADHPWSGVGAGNFQDYYTEKKLPEASEEIRDPHNFILEVWATGGTLALAALGSILVLSGYRLLRPSVTTAARIAPAGPIAPDDRASVQWMWSGGALGLLMAFVVGLLFDLPFPPDQLLGALVVGGAVGALLWPWVLHGQLPTRLPALAAVALLVNLLAAGGIAYPGVAGSVWLLMALALNLQQGDTHPIGATRPRAAGRLLPIVGLSLASVAAVACYLTGYAPVLGCRTAQAEALAAPSPEGRMAALQRASMADPLSAEPWLALAAYYLERLQRDPHSAADTRGFMDAASHVLELRPHASIAWRQVGRWYRELYEATHEPAHLATAAQCFERAVQLYPNLAPQRGEAALVLAAGGQREKAAQQAAQALQLNEQTPHADKKLTSEMRRQLVELAGEPRR